MGLELTTLRAGVTCSTTEPARCPSTNFYLFLKKLLYENSIFLDYVVLWHPRRVLHITHFALVQARELEGLAAFHKLSAPAAVAVLGPMCCVRRL